ncbi:MAG: TolB family protein, partial [Woeseiaceae bacterium]
MTRDNSDAIEIDPTWSRDGRRVAFVQWTDAELGHIHTVSANGGRSRRATENPGHYSGPRYSPD